LLNALQVQVQLVTVAVFLHGERGGKTGSIYVSQLPVCGLKHH